MPTSDGHDDGDITPPQVAAPPPTIPRQAPQRRSGGGGGGGTSGSVPSLDPDGVVVDDDDEEEDVVEEEESVVVDDDAPSPAGTGVGGGGGDGGGGGSVGGGTPGGGTNAGNSPPSASSTALQVTAEPHLDSLYGLREVGKEAICWQLSSAKPGNGVEQLRDRTTETYWQSDGIQPHTIQIQFARRAAVSHVCLYLDYNLDESYTPKRLEIQAGMTIQDLRPAVVPVELNEPIGWCIVPLAAPPDPLLLHEEEEDDVVGENEDQESLNPVRAHLIQISILSMHQNGRDTHIRQVQLYGPRRGIEKYDSDNRTTTIVGTQEQRRRLAEDWSLCRTPEFSTVEMSQYSTIR